MASVAIYTRLSLDPTGGLQTATARQDAACRAIAAAREWDVVETFEDVDVSAYRRGTKRPSFERLVDGVRSASFDGILVWKLDRLVRRPAEFERLWSLCERRHIFLASATEPIDSSTEIGLAMVRILVTFASLESATTGLRLRAQAEQAARQGKVPICVRAYGFTKDWQDHVPEEAAVLREAARRLTAGESIRVIAQDFNRREMPAPAGGKWSTSSISLQMRMPRLVGDRTYHGEVVFENCFPPILSRKEFAKLSVAMIRPGRPEQRHLLSGLALCGLCGARLYGYGTKKHRAYFCHADDGCGRLAVKMVLADDWVTERVLRRLELGRTMPPVGEETDDKVLHALATRTSSLYNQRRQKQISLTEYLAARRRIERELRLALPPKALAPATCRELWPSLSIAQQHGVMIEVLERVTVVKGKRGGFDPNRLQLQWWTPDGSGSVVALDKPTLRRALLSTRKRPAQYRGVWKDLESAGQVLGDLSASSVCRFVIEGDLPAYRDGNEIKFKEKDLHDYMARSRILQRREPRPPRGPYHQ